MQPIMLSLYARILAVHDTLTARHQRSNRGQTASEYGGVIAVVAMIIAALLASGVGEAVVGLVSDAIASVGGG